MIGTVRIAPALNMPYQRLSDDLALLFHFSAPIAPRTLIVAAQFSDSVHAFMDTMTFVPSESIGVRRAQNLDGRDRTLT